MLNIRGKLILSFLLVAAIPTTVIGGLQFIQTKQSLREEIFEQENRLIQERAKELKIFLKKFEAQTKLAALYPPIQGIIRTEKNGGIDPTDGSTLKLWEQRLESIFSSVAQSYPELLQIRYLDESGQEVVRVNKHKRGIEIVKDAQLQDKSDRPYFKAITSLSKGQLHISPVELNQENGMIQVPHQPVIRFGTPIFDAHSGSLEGAIILNFSFEEILQIIQEIKQSGHVILTDEKGNFLSHPDEEKAFSHEKGKEKMNYFDEEPELRKNTLGRDFKLHYDAESEELRIWRKIYYAPSDKERYWILFSVINEEILWGPLEKLQSNLILSSLLALALIIVLGAGQAKSIAKPIQELTRLSETTAKGKGSISVNTDILKRTDEIGTLARTFQTMAQKLQKSYASLEKKVSQRTKQLREKTQYLEQEQSRDQAIFKSMGEGLVVTDQQGRILTMNPDAEKLTGHRFKDIKGKKWQDTIPLENEKGQRLGKNERGIFKALHGEKTFFREDCYYVRKDGTRFPVSTKTSSVLLKKKVIGTVIIFRDISSRKQDEKLRSEFVSISSHQLRTPLTAIRWFLELLLDEEQTGSLTNKQRELVLDCLTSGERMVALVNDLLDVSRLESGTMKPEKSTFGLVLLTKKVMKELEIIAEKKNITVNLKAPTQKQITSDRKLLQHVLHNLLTNAIKYTPEGGKVKVTITQKRDKTIRVEVKDQGIGIPKQEQKRLFQKFFRASNATKVETEGTGLGLFITKALVELLGGEIHVRSQEKKGTSFWFTLPNVLS